ncbi:MAG: hypothetical protein JXR07_08620 [Reichenbachiella sp.]
MISVLLSFVMMFASPEAYLQPCNVYGKIYREQNPGRADYRVFVEDSEAFADVLVFVQDNELYADRAGQWAFVENRSFANVYIYFEKNRNLADFTIAYTETESFAGCNR